MDAVISFVWSGASCAGVASARRPALNVARSVAAAVCNLACKLLLGSEAALWLRPRVGIAHLLEGERVPHRSAWRNRGRNVVAFLAGATGLGTCGYHSSVWIIFASTVDEDGRSAVHADVERKLG